MGLFSKDIKTMEDPAHAAGRVLRRKSDREVAAEDDRESHQPGSGIGLYAIISRRPRPRFRGSTKCSRSSVTIQKGPTVRPSMVSSRRPTKWRARSTTSRCLTPRSSGSAQAIQHYEISRYGTLIAWAQELGDDNVVALLNANLKEEKAAGKKLSGLAEGNVNRRATGRRAAAHSVATRKRTGPAKKTKSAAKRSSARKP